MTDRHVFRSLLIPGLLTLCELVAPATARAQGDTEAAETAAARALAVEGVKLAQADRCDAAVDKLDRAEKLKHSPIVLRYLGECQIELGHWVEGSESLRKLLREQPPEDASPAVTQAFESAAATLREVKPRIPSMKIILTAPADAKYEVKVDGKPMPASIIGVALPADPGEHEVEVTAPGFLKTSSSIKLDASASSFVTLELRRDPAAPPPQKAAARRRAPEASPAPAPAPSPVEDASAHGSRTGKILGYASYAVALGGLGVGIALGQSAIHDEKELRSSCPNQVCPPAQKDSLDFARTKGTLSTIGFAVAGGGLTLGTILLLTSSGSSSKNATAGARHVASGGFKARATVGVGSVAVAGEF